jgi:hypothetical protein
VSRYNHLDDLIPVIFVATGGGQAKLLGGQHHVDSLLLQKDHDELRRLRRTRIATDCVHIVGSFIESLARPESDLLAAPLSLPQTESGLRSAANRLIVPLMRDLCRLIWSAVFALFRSRAALHAEILFLRHQLNVLHRRSPKRVAPSNIDRLVFAGLYCLAPQVLDALKILKPETVIRWHRAGFGAYWRWRSRPHGGRPGTPHETRELIRGMSIANPLWGAPRIHGELLKLGIDVGQTTVAKYMAKRRRPPSQGWRTFLHNHADGIASLDLFVVPTISTQRLNGSLVRSRRPMVGKHRDTSSVTETPSTATFSPAAFMRWAFATGRLRHDRHGKTDMRSD